MELQAASEEVILGKHMICVHGSLDFGVGFPFSKVGRDHVDYVFVWLSHIKEGSFAHI